MKVSMKPKTCVNQIGYSERKLGFMVYMMNCSWKKVGVSLKFESRNPPISLRHANSLSMTNFSASRNCLKKFQCWPHLQVHVVDVQSSCNFCSSFIVPHSSFLHHGVVPKIHYFCKRLHTNGIKLSRNIFRRQYTKFVARLFTFISLAMISNDAWIHFIFSLSN